VLRYRYRRGRIIFRRRTRERVRIRGINFRRDGDSRVVLLVVVMDVDGGDTYLNYMCEVQYNANQKIYLHDSEIQSYCSCYSLSDLRLKNFHQSRPACVHPIESLVIRANMEPINQSAISVLSLETPIVNIYYDLGS